MTAILLMIMSIMPNFVPNTLYAETWMFTKNILQVAINSDEDRLLTNVFTFTLLLILGVISSLKLLPTLSFYQYDRKPIAGIIVLILTSQILHSSGQRAISDYFTFTATILILNVLINAIIFENKLSMKVLFILLTYAISILSRGATKELMIILIPSVYLVLNQNSALQIRSFKLVILAFTGILLFIIREIYRFIFWYKFDVKITDLFTMLFVESERSYSFFELLVIRAQNFYWNVGVLINVNDDLAQKFKFDWIWSLVPRPLFPMKPTELRNANEFGREIGFLSQQDFTTAANIPLVADMIIIGEGNLWIATVYMFIYAFFISASLGLVLYVFRNERLLKAYNMGACMAVGAWLMVAVDSGIVIWGTLWFKLLVSIIIVYTLRRFNLA